MSITKKDVGDFGEKACAKYVKRLGFKILARNVTIGKLETDIIATNKTHILFIEVKTRRIDKNNLTRPSDAVNSSKKNNLLNFAYYYLKTLPEKHASKQPRMDVCEISVELVGKKLIVRDLNYIENAFSR
ncbi:MAG: YraN family protein [Clostridia bacterium]|nr:YraN family protein [Clostridia bacterium]